MISDIAGVMFHRHYPQFLYRASRTFALPKREVAVRNPMYWRGFLGVVGIWGATSLVLDLFGVWMNDARFEGFYRRDKLRRDVGEWCFEMPAASAANPISHFSQF